MAGYECVDDSLVVHREPNDLDELAIRFSAILDDLDIYHVYVLGYVAILTGHSRETEVIHVLLERVDEEVVDDLVERLDGEGMWGPVMPLQRMNELLEANIWVADAGEIVPHLEVMFVEDRFDREFLIGRQSARIGGSEVPIGPLELQIAYELWMGSQTDFEDAVHLYSLFEGNLRTDDLKSWVDELDVEEEYKRLKRA